MKRHFGSIAAVALAAGIVAAPVAAQGYGQTVLVNGDELLVGESLYATQPGYVYVYRKDGSGRWTQTAKLQASDAEPNDHFGRTLLVAEGDLLVGSTISRESGALYVFRKGTDGQWREVQSMVPNNAHPDDSFGRVGATNGRIALMSDWAADSSRGAVYVFEKQGEMWRETARLAAPDGMPNDWFGFSVAIAGERIAIGARNKDRGRGVVYTYRRAGTGWQESGRIVPPNAAPDTTPNLGFGSSLAFTQDGLLIGAPGGDAFRGAVYAYRDSGSEWTMASRIAAPEGTPQTNTFAAVMGVVGDEVWVGAQGVEAGRLFRLVRSGTDWQINGSITSSQLTQGDGFGGALSVSGSLALVGAIGDDFGYGSVVVMERRNDAWAETERLASEVSSLDPIANRIDCASGKAAVFDCNEVDVLSFLPVKDIGGSRGVQLNDVWGWTDARTGKEWAIVGRVDGTSFIDVSNPSSPVFAGSLPMHEGSQPNAWRDIKVYQDHAFIVADGAGPHGVQVFDLTRLRDVQPGQMPVTFTEDAHYDRLASAHNIVINEKSGFAFAVGVNSGGETCGGGLHMIDIRQPKSPQFAGCFQDTETGNQRTGYSHDAQCVIYNGPDEKYRGREICMGSNETALSIADVTEKGKPVAISHAAYPNVAYAHQGWLDENHEYFYMNDEGDEANGSMPRTRTLVWDVRDLDDPVLAKEYMGNSPAIDHNLYIVGNLMYQSNYVSGLRIVDISNRTEPKEVGFFDTVPWSEAVGFDGSWSNYPFFASGTIVVTSIKEGVFFLRRKTRAVS
jgi:choice-of-anchor B domain-containing protein